MFTELLSDLDALRAKINEAWAILQLDEVKTQIDQLEKASMSADFWTDQERAKTEPRA